MIVRSYMYMYVLPKNLKIFGMRRRMQTLKEHRQRHEKLYTCTSIIHARELGYLVDKCSHAQFLHTIQNDANSVILSTV